MAPNFLTKLRPHTRERTTSTASRNPSPSPSLYDASTTTSSRSLAVSTSTQSSGSSGPNVTIVPPSPSPSPSHSTKNTVASPADTPAAHSSRPPASPGTENTNSNNHTNNSHDEDRTAVDSSSLEMPKEGILKNKGSANSIRSAVNHPRSATSPAAIAIVNETTNAIIVPIAESPKHIISDTISSSPPANAPYNLTAGSTASFLQTDPATANPPPSSSSSPHSPKKKGSRWRKASPTRKPTGLASAIASSGLAMANPAMQVPVSIKPEPEKPKERKLSGTGSKLNLRKTSSPKAARTSNGSLEMPPRRSRRRRPSQSSAHPGSEGGDEDEDRMLPDEDSGSGSSDDFSDDDDEDLALLEEDIPVTGFAVASNKRNADFHDLFKTIPEGDYLIDDYGCAIQREILIQGRLYISENHICFHANIFGWVTDLSIPIYEITSLEKRMTAFVIPNAIQITTRRTKYTFASFLSRDTTYDVIFNIWRLSRPEDDRSRSSIDTGSIRGSMDASRSGLDLNSINGSVVGVVGAGGGVAGGMKGISRKVTMCKCGKEGKHYSETALETVLPGTPDRIHNLIFASGFIKDFMRVDQKLLDIQISDWAPVSADSKLLARNMSYIKPLGGSLGPKQTKCEIRDETVYCDFEDYVATVTTTRTPDVPSGGVFSVKTRTCITWASIASTKVVVTTQVEWTGRSFIKGIIEKSAIDGQKVYHSELDKAMRMYIQEHKTEFIPEGVDPAAVAPVEPITPAVDGFGLVHGEDAKEREHERNQRAFQWAYDTFGGAYGVAKQSTNGALELIRDAWDQSTSTTILYFVIVILVMSNLWTLMRMGSREEAGRRKEMRKMEEREKWVQGVVTALWDEMAAGKVPGSAGRVDAGRMEQPTAEYVAEAVPVEVPRTDVGNLEAQVTGLRKTLDDIEERVQSIRESLNKLD